MVSAVDYGTFLSRCLSPPRHINRNWQNECWAQHYNGLADHVGRIEILLVASCYRNRFKLGLNRPLA